MKKILMFMVAALYATASLSHAQEGASLSEAWQTGLTFVTAEKSIELPDRWILGDRSPIALFSARSIESAQVKMSYFTIPSASADQTEASIVAELKKKGEVTYRPSKQWGNAGTRRTCAWYLKPKEGVATYQIAHLNALTSRTDVLRIEWPLEAGQTPEAFEELTSKEIEAITKDSVESFFNGKSPNVGSGIVYNGTIANEKARVTLKLPPEYVYTLGSKEYVQIWVDKNEPGKTFSLAFRERADGFASYREQYPMALLDSARAMGMKDSDDQLPGTIDAKISQVKGNNWDYVYVSTVPILTKVKEGDKGKLSVVNYLNWQRFSPAGDSGVIISVSYREPIKLGENPAVTDKHIQERMAALAPVFDTFDVKKVSK